MLNVKLNDRIQNTVKGKEPEWQAVKYVTSTKWKWAVD